MRKLLMIVIACVCSGCSFIEVATAKVDGGINVLPEKEYKNLIEQYSIENIEREDFYEMEVSFEWSTEVEITDFRPIFIKDWESIIQSYDGETGYFISEENSDVDYEKNKASYHVEFIFYAKDSDEKKLKELFENKKFVVVININGEEALDEYGISSLINLD
ncbi:MAG: hypothetical protein RR595_10545 [Lysinibacillus sp.]